MAENNQMMSVEGQLVGLPLAGPESFSQQQLEYLKRALGVDETVLWTGEASGENATMNLSEAYTNFERVRFVIYEGNTAIPYWWSEVCTNGTFLYPSYVRTNSARAEVVGMWTLQSSSDNKTLTISIATIRTNGGTQGENTAKIMKIVGVHRIAGGNQ